MDVHINHLVNPASMKHDIDNGLIKVRKHPSLPLDIYNYTEKAQYSKRWSKATLLSRGLILNRNTGLVVARPFSKFFNYEEKPYLMYEDKANLMSMQEPVVVTDKMDGSLGIMYQAVPGTKTVPYIATRGSFESEQAKKAMQILWRKYPDFYPREGWTYLFEIVYPENRIVVDYDGVEDLFLLGAVDIMSGAVMGSDFDVQWPGPRAQVLPAKTLEEALRMPPRPGKEGVVVRSLMDNYMLKVKQEDYVKLHKIVTGLNRRAVWEMLKDGLNPYEGIPDEFHTWVSEVASDLQREFDGAKVLAYHTFNDIKIRMLEEEPQPKNWTRGMFASYAKKWMPWLSSCLFLLLDNKDIDEYLWKMLRPEGEENKK